MGEQQWQERAAVGYLAGLGVALYVVAATPEWDGVGAGLLVALLAALASVLLGASASTPAVRRAAILACALVVTVVLLFVVREGGGPAWLGPPVAPGSDAVLWQVHATFLAVGFAGLALAAHLFAEAPLAIGASRRRVLDHVWAGWFAGVGVVASCVMAVETIWLPSDLGVTIAACWFALTLVVLVLAARRMTRLFDQPAMLDRVVRDSLVESVSHRLDRASRAHAAARAPLDDLRPGRCPDDLGPSAVTLRVPVPQPGRVVRNVRPEVVRSAVAVLAPTSPEPAARGGGRGDRYPAARVTLGIEPGDRTRPGDTAFSVRTPHPLDPDAVDRLVRLLRSSIELEPPGFVTPEEDTDREVAALEDAIATSLRTGAFRTAERALVLLGEVVLGVRTTRPAQAGASRRSSSTRGTWLSRSIAEVERDVRHSRRAADLFVGQAMSRALVAPGTGDPEYADECLRSFTRLWSDVLDEGRGLEALAPRIATCVRDLALSTFATTGPPDELQPLATWAMVDLVKLALDARDPAAARLAARELRGLGAYADRHGSGRAHVRAGQLVLSGWLHHLAATGDERDPDDGRLRTLVTPEGTPAEILAARRLAEPGTAPFTRWDQWEMTASGLEAQVLVLPHHVDRATVSALAASGGPLPPARDQEVTSDYRRFLRLLDQGGRDLDADESDLKQRLTQEVSRWGAVENDRLAHEPLSADRIAALVDALRETLDSAGRLAVDIPTVAEVAEVAEGADASRPVLGMNLRVPRSFLVDEAVHRAVADPAELGRVIGRGFVDGEDRRIVDELRSLRAEVVDASATAMGRHIDDLGDAASHHVLLTPYGGLPDVPDWHSPEVRDSLARVRHLETTALEGEAILFDRRDTLVSCRLPEDKDGLDPVAGTSLALGVFEDVRGEGEPQVRVETGELFVVWPGRSPRVTRFVTSAARDADD